MLYLNKSDIDTIGVAWEQTISIIEQAVECIGNKKYAQPKKPYLRYGNMKNRIIAMPAYVGDGFHASGIKWIASFPGNIERGIPRAHSVMILNNADTGLPEAMVNTALLSIIRTASVSGLVIKRFLQERKKEKITIGIIGWGPIGQYHYRMCKALLKDTIEKVRIYDIREITINESLENNDTKTEVVKSWQDAYRESDIVITCTVSMEPYINEKPKKGSLQLNVSLRDYCSTVYDYFKKSIIVDDWDEVCRENTDIERMSKERGLTKSETNNIVDLVVGNCVSKIPRDVPVMFNPMGMAVFDIAIGSVYSKWAREKKIGIDLPD